LLLVRHAPTSATHDAAFPADEPLDADARGRAAALAELLPARCDALCSPALRCRQTASAARLDPQLEPEIAECDFGSWSGRTLAEVHAADPSAAGRWMTDPHARPGGGESLVDFVARIARWLDGQASEEGAAVAVTHGGVVKAAVVHALAAPIESFWRIEAVPLAVTELGSHNGRWTVARLNSAGIPA
jgi:broad specificity phosphatase PhoE